MAEPSEGSQRALEPTRDPRATLPDLIEVLLNKGVHLDLDLIISVAEIPLIGVNLRATIAGIETMLEYGMMRQWDEQTRAWVRASMARHLPLADGEDLIAKMAGGHYQEGFHRTWRPGSAYLTDRRLIIHRRDPAETLWQAPLAAITAIRPIREDSVGGEQRTRILVTLEDGTESKLSAVEPDRLISLVREQTGLTGDDEPVDVGPLREGPMWYLEPRADGGIWRTGRAVLSADEGLVWRSPLDMRAPVRIQPAEITAAELTDVPDPTADATILELTTADGTIRLSAPDIAQWQQQLQERKEVSHGTGSR
ncbi:gas vesicle protein [Brachybacterium sp. GCM10030268]|uniref:gas vesicle protein n=1 Tax=Brachybacterium sp. GCM10030268 TaxID=3273382 RepID=UPI00360E7709